MNIPDHAESPSRLRRAAVRNLQVIAVGIVMSGAVTGFYYLLHTGPMSRFDWVLVVGVSSLFALFGLAGLLGCLIDACIGSAVVEGHASIDVVHRRGNKSRTLVVGKVRLSLAVEDEALSPSGICRVTYGRFSRTFLSIGGVGHSTGASGRR